MQFLSLIVKQKKRKHQAQKKKSDSSQAKKCRLLHKSIMGDCYKIFWTKTSVPYLMRSEATQRANGSVKQTNKQPQNKNLIWTGMFGKGGWLFSHLGSTRSPTPSPHTELGAHSISFRSQGQRSDMVRQVSHANQIFHDESLWKFSFNFALSTFWTDSDDRHSFLSLFF